MIYEIEIGQRKENANSKRIRQKLKYDARYIIFYIIKAKIQFQIISKLSNFLSSCTPANQSNFLRATNRQDSRPGRRIDVDTREKPIERAPLKLVQFAPVT